MNRESELEQINKNKYQDVLRLAKLLDWLFAVLCLHWISSKAWLAGGVNVDG